MKALIVAWTLVFALVCCGETPWAAPAWTTVRVASVQDGDTFSLTDGRRVRAAGIDTPESYPPQYGAEASSRRAAELLRAAGGRIRIRVLDRDRYGRLVAEVRLASGKSFNETMLREGLAIVYWHKKLPEAFGKRLLKAQKEAISRRSGNWDGVLGTASSRETFVGNRNSLRFFSKDCEGLRRVSRRNRVRFSSLEEAFEKGFYPARECGIWPARNGGRKRGSVYDW